MHAEHKDFGLRRDFANAGSQVEAAKARHGNIENNNHGVMAVDKAQALAAVTGGADYLNAGGHRKDGAEALPEQKVVINEQGADAACL